jgi:hypothetical protein
MQITNNSHWCRQRYDIGLIDKQILETFADRLHSLLGWSGSADHFLQPAINVGTTHQSTTQQQQQQQQQRQQQRRRRYNAMDGGKEDTTAIGFLGFLCDL